jgi:hypothetical protein
MNIGKAFAVFQQIDSEKYTKDEKNEAIQNVINAATINSITKRQVLDVVSYLFDEQNKYRWHDLRKNPADLPEDNKDVLVTIKGGCVNRTWHDSCGWRNATAKKARHYSDKSVLAWKEIEEFENDEI